MAGPLSSVNGDATWDAADIPDVLKWSVNPKSGNNEYASSDTAGWKKRLAGIKDLSGSIECLLPDTAVPPMKAGASGTLVLKHNGVKSWSGPAIIDDISVTTDVQTGAPIGFTINFSANGEWTDWS